MSSSTARSVDPVRVGCAENAHAIFALATSLHEEGHLEEAETVYWRILEGDGGHGGAWHHLGLIHHQRGENAQALPMLFRAGALLGRTPRVLRHQGEVYRALHRLDDAVRSFEAALAIDPDDTDCMCNLAHAHAQRGAHEEAARWYRRVLRRTPDDVDTLTCLGAALQALGEREGAIDSFRRAIALAPGHDEALHLLAAACGKNPRTAPRAYVMELFDRYASTFERHLTNTLHYAVPEVLRHLAVEEIPALPVARAADLGCGTGLCGVAFRDLTRFLIGVDLSPRMVDEARRRGIYDLLVADDLTAALRLGDDRLDLAVAGDVLIYVGDLRRVFARTARALVSGGHLLFSTERADGDGYELRSSGRFAHSPAYVERLAARTGFTVVRCEREIVRIEAGEPVTGDAYVLRAC